VELLHSVEKVSTAWQSLLIFCLFSSFVPGPLLQFSIDLTYLDYKVKNPYQERSSPFATARPINHPNSPCSNH